MKWERQIDVSELASFHSHMFTLGNEDHMFFNWQWNASQNGFLVQNLAYFLEINFPHQELNILLETSFFSVWSKRLSQKLMLKTRIQVCKCVFTISIIWWLQKINFYKILCHWVVCYILHIKEKIFLFDFFLKPDITVPKITFLLKMLA